MNFHTTVLKYFTITLIVFLSLILYTSPVFSASLAEEEQSPVLSEAELAQTLAPIALYPDTLLTHILIASTYPIEVIQAERWLKKNSSLTATQRETEAEQNDWDISIKALLAFPQVLEKLSEDLTWMQTLGDAFLQDEARVLVSIQTLRLQADQAGSLANMDNVKVIKDQTIIIIKPAQAEIIYVPYYDTRVVYGRWHWSHYPPVYWRNPHYYAAHHGYFYWGHGVRIRSQFYFSAFHWHKRHVIVNHYNRTAYQSRQKIVTSHQAKRWDHQPKHRRGVAYSSGRLKQKYYRSSPNINSSDAYKGYKGNTDKKNTRNNKVIHTNKVISSSHVSEPKAHSNKERSNKVYSVNNRSRNRSNHNDNKNQRNKVDRSSSSKQSSKKSPRRASASVRQSDNKQRELNKHLLN